MLTNLNDRLGEENYSLTRNMENITAEYNLTIVVPVYNEQENVFIIGQKISEFIHGQTHNFACVLFVNDGSTDNSVNLISNLCDFHKHFYYISFEINKGLSAALKAGFDQAQSEYVGYIDADLQTTPEDFNLLIPYLSDFEMVMGIRTHREDSFLKRISSKIANSFRRFMTKDGIFDTGCPLKIIRSEYACRIPMFNGMHRFLPALVQLQNGRVKQIPVRHFPRIAGKSKYNLRNRFFAPFIDCFVFRWMKSRYINYFISQSNIR